MTVVSRRKEYSDICVFDTQWGCPTNEVGASVSKNLPRAYGINRSRSIGSPNGGGGVRFRRKRGVSNVRASIHSGAVQRMK